MYRLLIPLLLLTLGAAVLAANVTVTLNGKAVTVPVIESNGKAFVDVAALMKLLGGQAAYNATAHKVAIATTAAPPVTAHTSAQDNAQLPGENGELNQVYTMRKDTPLYFRLTSAEYTTEQVRIGDKLYAPTADQKLLVLHFTVQNPLQQETLVRFDSLLFTVVDAMNVNHEAIQDWGDAESHNTLEISLKYKQRIAAYAVVPVPAKGLIPKLMVIPQRDDNGGVLRYDLHGKVTALQAPVADPTDATGSTALAIVPAQLTTSYPYKNFSIAVTKFAYATDAIGDYTLENGERFLVATLHMKNAAPIASFLRNDSLAPVVTTNDGQELRYKAMLFATANQNVEQDVKAGLEMGVRIIFTVPQGATPKTLALKEGDDSRVYSYAIPQ